MKVAPWHALAASVPISREPVKVMGSEPLPGTVQPAPPLVCVADSYLVVACREVSAMKLRTYALGEEG